MYSEVHANYVLYKGSVEAGTRYRQIVVVEKEQFEVRIFEGTVFQADPKFLANSSDAETYFHESLGVAFADAANDFRQSVGVGWIPYTGHTPQ